MAIEKKTTVFEIQGDSASYRRSVEEALQLKDRLANGFKLLAQDLQAVNRIADSFLGTATIQRAEEFAAAVQKVGGVSKLTKEDQQRLNEAVSAAIPYYERLGATAPAHLLALQEATKKVETQTKSLGDSLKEAGSKSLAAGATLTASVTAPLAGIATLSVKAAMEFESAFAGVRKTVSGTPAELDAINTQFREMAKVTPVSAVGLSKIGEMAGQLGVEKTHITDFTKTIVDISTATNLTADEAGTAFAKLANVMKLPQDQFSNLGSAVVALGNFGASTEQEMLNMAQRISAAGATAGFTAPQVLGIANALSSVGIEAEAGGTAISRVIVKMSMDVASGGGHLQTFAKVAGMTAQEFSAAWRDNAGATFSKFMQGLADARKHGGDELLGLIHELGFDANVRLANAFLSAANAGDLMRESIELGTKSFAANTELTRAAGERYKTAANQLEILKNNLNDVAIELGNALIPVLNDAIKAAIPFVHTLEDAVRWFEGLPEPVKVTVLALAGIAAAIGPALLAFGGMARGVTSLVELYGLLVPAAAGAEAALAGGAVATGTAAGAFALLLNPITLTIGALGLLAGAIYVASTQQSELEKSLHSNVDAFKATTTQLDTLLETYQSLKDKQNLTKEETEKLETATRELAKSSGLSVDAFKREEAQSNQLTSALREQLKARKDLLIEAIDQARGKMDDAFRKLDEAKETMTRALKGELLSEARPNPGFESAGASMTAKERIQEVQRLNGVIADLEKEANSAKAAYQGLSGALAKDISIPGSAAASAANAAKQTADYVKQLADAREHLAGLSAEQRANLTAAVALHTAYDKLAPGLVQSAAEYDLFKESLSKGASEFKKSETAAKKHQEAIDAVAAATEQMSQATYDAIAAEVAHATANGKSLGIEEAIAKKLDVNVVLVKRVMDAEKERATANEKYAKAMEASQAEVDSLLSDAEARELKASGDTTQAKIVDVGKWMIAKVAALNKEAISEEEYWRRIVAIAKDGQAKVDEITADAEKKHQEELDKLEAEDQKSADATALIWEKYNALVERGTNDRISSQIAAVKIGADKQLAAVQAELTKQLAAVRANIKLTEQDKQAAEERERTAAKKQSDAIVALRKAEIDQIRKQYEALNFDEILSSIERLTKLGGQRFQGLSVAIGLTHDAIGSLTKGLAKFTEAEKLWNEVNEQGEHVGHTIANFTGLASSALQEAEAVYTLMAAYVKFADAKAAAQAQADRQGRGRSVLNEAVGDQGVQRGQVVQRPVSFSDTLAEQVAKDYDRAIAFATRGGTALQRAADEAAAKAQAVALNLSAVIAEMGGLTSKNLAEMEQKALPLFDLIAKHGKIGQDAQKELNSLVGEFAAQAQKSGGLWDQNLQLIIKRAKEAGVELDAVNALIKGQQDKVAAGATGVTSSIGAQAAAYVDLKKAVDDAAKARQDALDNGQADDTTAGSDAQRAKFRELDQALTDANTKFQKVTKTSQDEFDRLSRIELGAFNTLVASGVDAVTAMGQVGTGVDALIKNVDAFGLSGNAAFDELKRWRTLTTENAPLLSSIGSLNDLMVASANLGTLTAESFSDMEAQGVGAFNQLQKAFTPVNASEEQARQARIESETAEKPFLESVIKLHNEKHLAINAETQALIDQAKADDVLGEQEASTQQTLREGLGALIETLGGKLPEAWEKFSQAGKDAADKVAGKDGLGKVGDALTGPGGITDYLDDGSEEWKVWKREAIRAADEAAKAAEKAASDTQLAWDALDIKPIPIEFQYRTTGDRPDLSTPEPPSDDSTPGFAAGTRGQFLDFGAGTLVRLHGLERVMTKGEASPLANFTPSNFAGLAPVHAFDFGQAVRALGQRPADLTSVNTFASLADRAATSTFIFELDGKVLTRANVKRQPGEVKRLQLGRR